MDFNYRRYIMDEKFINKCFENWKAIVEYIQNEYKDIPRTNNIGLLLIAKPNGGSYSHKLEIRENGEVELYAMDDYAKDYPSDYTRDYFLTRGIRTKEINDAYVTTFCRCIQEVCKDWEAIKKRIQDSKAGYCSVMNFKI